MGEYAGTWTSCLRCVRIRANSQLYPLPYTQRAGPTGVLKWSKATPFGNLGSVKATVQEGMQCATGGSRNSPQLNTLRTNPARKSGDEKRKVAAGGKGYESGGPSYQGISGGEE